MVYKYSRNKDVYKLEYNLIKLCNSLIRDNDAASLIIWKDALKAANPL